MNSSHILAFVLGAVGKVAGTWLADFFKYAVLPYLSLRAYPHICLQGRWRVQHVDEPLDGDALSKNWELQIDMKHSSNSVSGTAFAVCTEGGIKGKRISYTVTGTFKNNVLDVTLNEDGKETRNRSSFLLQIVGQGSTLEGYRMFLWRNKNEIRAIACIFTRSNSSSNCEVD